MSVAAAEAGHAARDEDHEADGDTADDEQELQVDLAVAAGEPLPALAGDLLAPEHALAVAVAEVALGRGGWKVKKRKNTAASSFNSNENAKLQIKYCHILTRELENPTC